MSVMDVSYCRIARRGGSRLLGALSHNQRSVALLWKRYRDLVVVHSEGGEETTRCDPATHEGLVREGWRPAIVDDSRFPLER